MAFIGIDLGTTNSLVAIWKNGHYQLIPNSLGQYLTPSAVSLDEDGKIIVGKAAKDRLVSHPDRTIAYFKRFMGTKEDVLIANKHFSPEELSALILKQLKEDAEVYLDEKIDEAIISVPAYFNDNQRNSTKIAAQLAGLKVERLINEPTAAAIAYGVHEDDSEKKFIVIDLGGGTFDVSIMEKFENLLEVHSSAGDSFLGGEDFTKKILIEVCKENDIEYEELDGHEYSRLYRLFNNLKCELSEKSEASAKFKLHNKEYSITLTEKQLFIYLEPLIKRLLAPIEQSIRDANIEVSAIDDIFLVGGATRMPAIRQFITRLFNRFPSYEIDPDHVVAIGAAIQASLKERNKELEDIVLTDVCPFSMGIESATQLEDGKLIDGVYSVIISRNQVIPVSRVERFYTIQNNQTAISIKIYQGEHRIASNNIKLGELEIQVPKKKAGEESVDVRFTYDINGLLEVVVTVVSTGKTKDLVIQNSPNRMSEGEIQTALKKLAKLKIHPRDMAENQALISHAERLYQEYLGIQRDNISNAIIQFQACLDRQDKREIEKASREFKTYLESLENDIWN